MRQFDCAMGHFQLKGFLFFVLKCIVCRFYPSSRVRRILQNIVQVPIQTQPIINYVDFSFPISTESDSQEIVLCACYYYLFIRVFDKNKKTSEIKTYCSYSAVMHYSL